MTIEEIDHPIENADWYIQGSHFLHHHRLSGAIGIIPRDTYIHEREVAVNTWLELPFNL